MRPWTLAREVPQPAAVFTGGILMISIVYFMVVPLLALHLARNLHEPPARIGIVLAIMSLTNQGLQVVVGVLAFVRLGHRQRRRATATGTVGAYAEESR